MLGADHSEPPGSDQSRHVRRLSGRITADDDAPISFAFAGFMSTGRQPITVPVSANGEFALELPSTGGGVFIAGAIHRQTLMAPVVFDAGSQHTIAARLAPLEWPGTWDGLRVVGSFNHFADDASAIPLVPRETGEFVADVPSPEPMLKYQITGLWKHARVPVAGTMADQYERGGPMIGRGPGGIVSVVRASGPRTSIVFTPATLPKGTATSSLQLDDASSTPARMARLGVEIEGARLAACGHGAPSPQGRADFTEQLRRLTVRESPGILRQYSLIQYLESGGKDRELATEVMLVGPESPVWTLGSVRAIQLAALVLQDTARADSYERRWLESRDVTSGVKAAVWFERMMRSLHRNPKLADEAYRELLTRYADSSFARMARQMRERGN
jgi:hypothetical protein